jgi:hypothetical protein
MTADGHQVRLQTPPINDAPSRLEFGFVSATNLHSKGAPHMRRVIVTIIDPDHYTSKWTKSENGKDTEFVLNFVRR